MRNSPPSLTLSLQPSQPVDIEPPHALVPFPHALLHPHRRKFSGALGEEKKQRCARKEWRTEPFLLPSSSEAGAATGSPRGSRPAPPSLLSHMLPSPIYGPSCFSALNFLPLRHTRSQPHFSSKFVNGLWFCLTCVCATCFWLLFMNKLFHCWKWSMPQLTLRLLPIYPMLSASSLSANSGNAGSPQVLVNLKFFSTAFWEKEDKPSPMWTGLQ